ncbi:MAG TPA: hypothetical protein VEZ55_12380 [Chitinophagaceae bacterium]|jgi:hypothetical protein|nr:hypothetical protein [Chitinophagaceae bacterium]
MKQTTILAFLSALILFSCRKEDNPQLPDLIRVPVPLITKDVTTDQTISAQDPTSFNGKFVVDLFFKDDVKPQKVDVVVIKNGDKSNVKTIKTDVSTFPTTVTITGTELAALFGTPVLLGDKYDVSADVTMANGQKFLAFPAVGEPYGSGVANQPGASTLIRYEVVCKFDPAAYSGNFEVISDEWEDYAAGTIVNVTVVNPTTLSFVYAASNAQPIQVTVDPNTNATSVSKQVYGTYSWGAQYGDFSVASVPSLNNYVAPCEGILSVVLNHTVSAGSFGNYRIVLKKKG